MTASLQQPVVVENRPGANGVIGSDAAARATPDGYTLLMVAPGHASNISLNTKLPYDTLRDFQPISLLVTQPSILVVNPSLRINSVQELIALAKEKPGTLSYASGGIGSGQHLAAEMFKYMTKIEALHVAYKGVAPAEADVLAGQVSMIFAPAISALPHIRSGRFVALGITSEQRSGAAPDLLTISEAGVAGYSAVSWLGLLSPKGVPMPIVEKLHAEVARILKLPDVQERLAGLGAEAQASSPAQFDAFIRDEVKRWGNVIKANGIKAE
jgi:tripartite-type tricarboxylate transporter receptor subunit TctC